LKPRVLAQHLPADTREFATGNDRADRADARSGGVYRRRMGNPACFDPQLPMAYRNIAIAPAGNRLPSETFVAAQVEVAEVLA
jgi:hypothetical protein